MSSIISDSFHRPFLGAPTVLATDASPSRIKRTDAGHLILPAVRPSAAIKSKYDATLRRLLDEMNNSVLYWLGAAYKREDDRIAELAMAQDVPPANVLRRAIRILRRRWLRRFDDGSQDLARYFATAIHRRSATELKKILKRAGISVEFKISREIRSALSAIVEENVSLIRSIPEQYFTQIEGMVMRSVIAGRDLASLNSELRSHYGVTKRRAELISLDQNNKASSAINRLQYLEVGIERAIWRHSHAGKEPRPTHVANDGKEYEVRRGWYDPHERKYIRPGELIRCRCYSEPILPRG